MRGLLAVLMIGGLMAEEPVQLPDDVRAAAAAALEAYAAEQTAQQAARAAVTPEMRTQMTAVELALMEANQALRQGKALDAGRRFLAVQRQLADLPEAVGLGYPNWQKQIRIGLMALGKRLLQNEQMAVADEEDEAVEAKAEVIEPPSPATPSQPVLEPAPDEVVAAPSVEAGQDGAEIVADDETVQR